MSASVGRSESMSKDTLLIDGVRVPRFLYGTAWKEDDTARLTELALRAGFRGIDTANQRKHYHEAAVGRGVAAEVEQSFASSLAHLGTDTLDSYVLHGPSRGEGLGPADWEAWRAMEALHV